MNRERLEDLRTLAALHGTDDQYLDWVRRQASCISGKFSEWVEPGEWRNPACHVRRAVHAGTAKKPEFSAVPMTNQEHDDQSLKGEAYCLTRHSFYEFDRDSARDFFDLMVVKHLKKWLATTRY